MRTLQVLASVAEDGTLTAKLPPDVPAGEHEVVLQFIEEAPVELERPSLDFPVDDVGPWPEGLSLRREDMYDDWGRRILHASGT